MLDAWGSNDLAPRADLVTIHWGLDDVPYSSIICIVACLNLPNIPMCSRYSAVNA